jgi:hypothetical protein
MEPFFSYVSGENILSCCLIVFRNDVNIYDKNVSGEILRKKAARPTRLTMMVASILLFYLRKEGGKTTCVILPPFAFRASLRGSLFAINRKQSPACSGYATTGQSVAPENYVATNE